MASNKRSRTGVSSSKGRGTTPRVAHDERFVSPNVEEMYKEVARKGRGFIDERGFAFESPHYGVTDTIRDLGWGAFTAHLKVAIEPLVMEFYTNAFESRQGNILIRGNEVSFDAEAINKYYRLPDIPLDHDEHSIFTKDLDYDQVL